MVDAESDEGEDDKEDDDDDCDYVVLFHHLEGVGGGVVCGEG